MSAQTQLIIYSLITFLITLFVLLILKSKIKKEETKDRTLKMVAVVTVLIHYSSLWVEFVSTGSATIDSNMLFPIYPCNIVMWLLLITAFIKNKQSRFFQIISEFTAYAGIVCGVIGVVINENFFANPNFLDYGIFKGLLSHNTMILGAAYLFTMKYVTIRLKSNMFSAVCGLLFFVVDGLLVNTFFSIFNLPAVNAMYLQQNPFPEIPWLNTFTMGVLAIILLFIFTSIYEYFYYQKEERWYYNVKKGH